MDKAGVEAVVGRLYLAVLDLREQNQQLVKILDEIGVVEKSTTSDEEA